MMKSTIAVVASAMGVGAAYAQSSVTIYGVISLGITKANGGTSNTAAANTNGNATARGFGARDQWGVQTGSAPRLGFRGREDLGGGMYARFDIQHRFSPDTGTSTSNTFWAGRSIVALGGIWGEILLGREYTPVSYIGIAADPTDWAYVARFDGTYTLAGYGSGSVSDGSYLRHSNAVGYRSGKINGFALDLQIAAGEGGRPKAAGGGSLVYSNGPVYAGIGVDGMDGDNRVYALTAAYDFGFVRPIFHYADARGGFVNSGNGGQPSPSYRATSYTLSATVPVGKHRAFVGFGSYDPSESGVGVSGPKSKATKFMMGYFHNLSKRTSLYVTAGSAKKDSVGTVSFTRSNAFDAGIRQVF